MLPREEVTETIEGVIVVIEEVGVITVVVEEDMIATMTVTGITIDVEGKICQKQQEHLVFTRSFCVGRKYSPWE
jgi:hypothetical protein